MPDTVSNVVSRAERDLNVRADVREAGGVGAEHVARDVDVNVGAAARPAAEPRQQAQPRSQATQATTSQRMPVMGAVAGSASQAPELDAWSSPGSMAMASLGRSQAAAGMQPTTGQPDQDVRQGGYDSGYVSVASVDSTPMSKRDDAYTPERRSKLYQNLLEEADEQADLGQAGSSGEPANRNAVGPYHGTDTMAALVERRRRIQAKYREAEGPVRQDSAQAARPESEWNSDYGYESGRNAPRTREAPTRRNRNLYRRVKNWMKNSFGTRGVGVRIYAKLIGLPSLGLRDVGVGIQEIMEAIDRDPGMVERLFAPYMTDDLNNVSSWTEQQVADFVNSHEIYVATYKAPNNRGQDVQRRRLVVLTNEQRGVYINPIMAAMYTADFDGDDIQVSLEPEMAKNARDPMSYMVGADDRISLDMAFLPVARIVADPSTGDSPSDYVRKILLAEYADVHGSAKDALVDAIVALGDTYNLGEDYQEDAYAKVFRAARRFADWLVTSVGGAEYATSSDRVMERICSAVYQGMRNAKVEEALNTFGLDVDVENLPKPRTYGDHAIVRLAEGLAAGRVPNNFQELKVMLTGFVGNVEKKNAPFRFSADVGKMMKMDPRLQVGDGEFGTIDENGDFKVDPNSDVQMELLFKSTVKYAESYHMAKEVKRAGRVEYYSQRMRDRVIGEVGFFDDVIDVMGVPTRRYTSYQKYLQDFCDSYNRNSAIINQANLVFLSNMGIALNESNRACVSPIRQVNGTYQLGDIAEPLLAIYGSYSVERMFSDLVRSGVMSTDKKDKYWLGNPDRRRTGSPHVIERESNRSAADFWVTGKYMAYNLRAFAHENRLVQSSVVDIQSVRKTTLASMADGGRRTNESMMYDVLMAIADKGTGAASKFNKSVYGTLDSKEEGNAPANLKSTVQMIGELASELKGMLDSPTRDQMQWIDDIVSALVESGPDMFYYFGMDSAAGFLNSRWGKALVDAAGNDELLGGIRTAMVFEWRMRYVTDIERNLPNPDTNSKFAVGEFVDEMNKLKFARDELADSSEVWRGIMREIAEEELADHKSVFQMMRESPRRTLVQRSNGISYDWKVEYDASDYWRTIPDDATLRSVIEDITIDRKTKWSIIADVVRYWEQDAYLKSYEVGYQLEIGNDAAYSLGTAEKQGALKAHNDFNSAFTRWGKVSRQRMVENISEASGHYRQLKGTLTKTLGRLDECPWELVSIDDGMYADSLMSVKDKTYAQTEKASQHPWTNAIYSALMFQRNGGYMNDVTRTDDRLLGMVSVDQVDIHDVIHILADPNASMWVYNGYGEYGEVTRDLLLSSALGRDINQESVTEEDIWEFLESEPRIASAIRRHSACVNTNSKGDGYIGASTSTEEAITLANDTGVNPIDNVKYLMRNHPVYAGIISLASKSPKNAHGDRVGAVPRNERNRVMRIEEHLCRLIYRAASESDDHNMAAQEILASLGITPQSVMDALKSDYDAYLDAVGLPKVAMSTSRFELNEAESDARFTYNVACSNLAAYIGEVSENVPLGRGVPPYVGKPTLSDAVIKNRNQVNLLNGIDVGVDTVSIASFWDVIQELGGSKTNVSTGIEGAETYNWGVWASHMTTRDKYADLECVSDDIDQSWDGAWTNVRTDKGPATLEVDEDGNAYIMVSDDDGPHMYDMDHLDDLKKAVDVDEIVVMVPDGYTVRDRSTDSYGNPLTSLFMYMVSKRSNGAEAFNLKAKKAGYDGSDSITKMDGKYRTITVKDADGNVVETRRASFFDIREGLRGIAESSGLDAAKLELAKMLKKENESFGYEDMTLSNYMCLADLMLIQGNDDKVYLRSLEMIFSAIKHRIGEQVDDMTADQLKSAIDSIVEDRGESGVGISMMRSQEAFNAIRPQSAASSMSGAKLSSSIWERNYDLLDSIASRHQGNVYPQNVVSERDSLMREVACVKSVLGRANMTRGYDVVGYVGPSDEGATVTDLLEAVGPSSMVVVGDGGNVTEKMVRDVCETAYRLGMSVVVSNEHLDAIPVHLRSDAIICSDAGDALIPMFDMRLNGSEARPYNGGQFSIFQVPYSRYVVSVEDSLNVHDLGDAQYRPTKSLVDRLKLRDSGSVKIRATDLFPNVFGNARFRNCSFKVTQATREDVEEYIAPGVRCTIDYGVVQGAPGFDQRRRDVDKAIQRYRENYWNTDDVDDDGVVTGECRPGDIVGWMKLEIVNNYTHKSEYVLSPIIPFPLHGTKKVPSRYRKAQLVKMDGDGTYLAFDWQNTSSIANSFAKYFDSSGGANKGMMNFADTIDDELVLLDGTKVDAYCAKQSTDSRKIGTDRRIKTMISLMAIARMHGYNFAADPNDVTKPNKGAFPNNPEFRERMLHERIPTNEWKQMLGSGDVTFSSDRRLNAFLNYECRKILANGGNPWDYLANKYTDANGNERNTHVMWEFEAMFEQGVNYENDLLRFLHFMDPRLCPNGIGDNSQECLFRLYHNPDGSIAEGYDTGVLQMRVPHRRNDSTVTYVWDNVYVGMSFFGDDFSGFSRPNVEGASTLLDANNTMAYYGAELDDGMEHERMMWATSDIGRIPRDGGAFGLPDLGTGRQAEDESQQEA